MFAAPAVAADSPYTVSNIHVDVSAKSSTEAFTNAIADGRPEAFQILYRRLTQQKDWPRQPILDAAGLLRLSRGYSVANERRSTTRYVADVTYLFNPDAVSRLLRGAGIAFTAQASAAHILLIPMAPGVTGGGWAQAFAAPSLQSGGVSFSLPSPDEIHAMASLNFDSATWNDVSAAAGHAHVNDAVLVQALYANGKVTVNIRRLGLGQTPVKTSVDVALVQTLSSTYPSAAQASVNAIDDLWKSRTTVDYSQRGRLNVDLRIAGVAQWGEIQSTLATIPLVTGVTLVAMDTGYARFSLNYIGSSDQLRDAMTAAHLSLTQRGGQWMLASAQ